MTTKHIINSSTTDNFMGQDFIHLLKEVAKDVDSQHALYALVIALTLFLTILFTDLFSYSLRIRRIAKQLLKRQTKALEELENQFAVLQSHAPTYINSLGEDGSRFLTIINSTLGKKREFLELISELLEQNEVSEIQHIITNENISDKWIMETRIQIYNVGKLILEASKRASLAGVPKRKGRREDTIMSLSRASIISNKQ
ncbi:MAG TPA: hypothetical protein PKA63_09100 [Oligoflexia bacterium]|nr:hypothetical protein [Oligoflexia bacterium]HMP48809.1 hypothetical protein [Oligoflexia bacterium]